MSVSVAMVSVLLGTVNIFAPLKMVEVEMPAPQVRSPDIIPPFNLRYKVFASSNVNVVFPV